jgi:hypothetical protein
MNKVDLNYVLPEDIADLIISHKAPTEKIFAIQNQLEGITEMVAEQKLATYINSLAGLYSSAIGKPPTLTVSMTSLLVLITEMASDSLVCNFIQG